jgi:hypothetical protein
MSGFDIDILLPAFTDIFCRRPKDVQVAGSSPAVIEAGKTDNIALAGKYLEGDINLYTDSSRITLSNIQQQGEYETTQVTADATATEGDDQNNIDVYGYTWGQDGNDTAKFNVVDAINIKDVEPKINSVTTSMPDVTYPEHIRFDVDCTENITKFYLETEGQVKSISDNPFFYSYKTYGNKPYSVYGKTAEGVKSNTISKTVNVKSRPYIEKINFKTAIDKYLVGDNYFIPYQIIGSGTVNLPNYDKPVPYVEIEAYCDVAGNTQDLYFYLYPTYKTGTLGYAVNRVDQWKYLTGHTPSTLKFNVTNKDKLVLKVRMQKPVYPNYTYTEIFLHITPFNTVNTIGVQFPLAVYIWQSPATLYLSNYTNTSGYYDLPTTSLQWYDLQGSPALLNAWGNIYNRQTAEDVYGLITSYNY